LILYIHLETVILFLFLAMVAGIQVQRAAVPGYYSRNPRQQIAGVAIVFLLLSAGLGTLLYSVSPLLGIGLAAGITLGLMHPANALCLFVHMLFLRPWEIQTANLLLLALPRILAGVCFISWLLYSGRSARPTARTMPTLLLLVAFSAWLFVTTFQATDVAAAQMDWFNSFFRYMLVFLMCLFLINDVHSVQELKWTLVLSTFALVVLGMYPYLFLPKAGAFGGRLHSIGMLGDSNDLAAGVVMALPLAVAPAFKPLASFAKRLNGVVFSGFSLIAIWFTQSRGALLAVVSQLFLVVSLYKPSGRGLRMVLMAAVLGVGYVLTLQVISRSAEEMEISQESRLIYWKAAANMTLHHPILGVGYGQYPVNYESYAATVKYEWGRRTAHSSWLLAFAESGLVGGALFIAFLLNVFRVAWKNRTAMPDQFYAMAGYLIAMSFLSHSYVLYPYLLSGLILASAAIQERTAHAS
jgi:O-antigen ligase